MKLIAALMVAISLSQPHMGRGLRKMYAEHLLHESQRYQVDPFLVAAIIHHESRWTAGVIGGEKGQCIGLGQHCLSSLSICRDINSAGCQTEKARLLDPLWNITRTFQHLRKWKAYCRHKTGRSLEHHILQGYQGFGTMTRVCGQHQVHGQWVDVLLPKMTRDVLAYRRKLRRIK